MKSLTDVGRQTWNDVRFSLGGKSSFYYCCALGLRLQLAFGRYASLSDGCMICSQKAVWRRDMGPCPGPDLSILIARSV